MPSVMLSQSVPERWRRRRRQELGARATLAASGNRAAMPGLAAQQHLFVLGLDYPFRTRALPRLRATRPRYRQLLLLLLPQKATVLQRPRAKQCKQNASAVPRRRPCCTRSRNGRGFGVSFARLTLKLHARRKPTHKQTHDSTQARGRCQTAGSTRNKQLSNSHTVQPSRKPGSMNRPHKADSECSVDAPCSAASCRHRSLVRSLDRIHESMDARLRTRIARAAVDGGPVAGPNGPCWPPVPDRAVPAANPLGAIGVTARPSISECIDWALIFSCQSPPCCRRENGGRIFFVSSNSHRIDASESVLLPEGKRRSNIFCKKQLSSDRRPCVPYRSPVQRSSIDGLAIRASASARTLDPIMCAMTRDKILPKKMTRDPCHERASGQAAHLRCASFSG
jgi:hypothetical protein